MFGRIAIPLLPVLLTSAIQAQTCGSTASSTIATDRPQITNSSIVVPCGSLQFENGFEQTGASGRAGFDLPETSIRFGITNKTELRFATPNYVDNFDTGAGFASGGGDSVLGIKQQLGPALGFDVSIIPFISLPTGAARISSHGYDPGVELPWSRSLTKVWTIAGQLSLLDPTEDGRRNVTGQASAYFDRAINSAFDAYVEYSGQFARRGGPQHTIDFGGAYKISPHQQLDLHANFGFAATIPTHTVGIGYSVRFQVVHARKQAGTTTDTREY